MKRLSSIVVLAGLLAVGVATDRPLREEGSSQASSVSPPESETSPALAPSVEQLQEEIAALRGQVEALQHAFDVYLGGIVRDLQAENERLRGELRRMYTRGSSDGAESAPMPRPYAESAAPASPSPVLDAIIARDESILQDAIEAGAPAAMTFAPLSEWGRTPEEAAELGDGTLSLKGAVGVVPAGGTRETLVALGRELRAGLGGYDNVNIEVFDDVASARAFIDTNASPGRHRVLTVSKHLRSGRDVILLYSEDDIEEIPWEE